MKTSTLIFTFFILLCTHIAMAQASLSPREKLSLDFGWSFHLDDINDYSTDMFKGGLVGRDMGKYFDPNYNDSLWRQLNLPHDFMVEKQFDKSSTSNSGLPNGIGWYRRGFKILPEEEGKRFILTFDGVSRFTEVFVNGFHVKTHRFGYDGFSVDITEALYYDRENIIMVRVNSLEGAEGWWYEGSGIYRHVWLEKVNAVHIPPNGIAINPALDLAMKNGNVQVEMEVVNEGFQSKIFIPEIYLEDSKGIKIGESKGTAVKIEPGEKKIVNLNIMIENPDLWSPETPTLYKLAASLSEDGKLIDGLNSDIGFRIFTFNKENGFFVNGKRTIIKGVCMHQDHAGVGVAVPDALLRYRLEKLKEMGVNAYRSHHPNAPEVSQMCNEMGILVLAETRHFSPFSESMEMLEQMVKQERNNPCIIAWCLGNEERIVGNYRSAGVVNKMRQLTRSLDLQQRPVTMAFNNSTNGPAAEAVDVVGYNYNTNRLKFNIKHDNPRYSSESASMVATRGEYKTDASKGVVSSYDRKGVNWGQSGEEVMDFTMTVPEVSGTFIWTGFDYRGEPTPYQWPNVVSNFGLLDLCGYKKDLSYFFESWWSHHDVLHILPHWNWENDTRDTIDVWVYSNFEEVELLLNGKSLGKQKMPKYKRLQWMVKYEAGELLAKGFRNGVVVDEQVVRTAAKPEKIKIEASRESIQADEQDVVIFNISVHDEAMNFCPNADNLLKFSVAGPARMLGVGNGNPTSHESDKLPLRKAFHGRVQVIVQASNEPGDITLTVTAKDLKEERCTIKSIVPKNKQERVPTKIKELELMKFYPKSELGKVQGQNKKRVWTLEEMYKETAGYSMDEKED